MSSYDRPSFYDQEWLLMLEESRLDELEEQEDFALAKGRYLPQASQPWGFFGPAVRRSSLSLRPGGFLSAPGASPQFEE
jgi:hypothetical protein